MIEEIKLQFKTLDEIIDLGQKLNLLRSSNFHSTEKFCIKNGINCERTKEGVIIDLGYIGEEKEKLIAYYLKVENAKLKEAYDEVLKEFKTEQ
jgi:hypothetical protein